MDFRVQNMTCGGCVRGVTAAIRAEDPAALVDADPDARSLHLDTVLTPEQVVALLDDAGFDAVPA